MHPTYPLTPELLNSIKQYVKAQSERFQTATIDLDTVLSIGGRRLAEAVYYPLKEAVALFENEGAGKKVPGPHQGHPGFFEIHDPSYFSIDFGALSLPVRFSLDKRIETDLLTMVEVYAQIYDVENRLRFFLTDKLKEKYGEPFADKLPRKVRDSIVRHKQPAAIFVEDKRIQDLEYAEFADLKGYWLQMTTSFPTHNNVPLCCSASTTWPRPGTIVRTTIDWFRGKYKRSERGVKLLEGCCRQRNHRCWRRCCRWSCSW